MCFALFHFVTFVSGSQADEVSFAFFLKKRFFKGPARGSQAARTVPARFPLQPRAPLGKPQPSRMVCGGCAIIQALGRCPSEPWRWPSPGFLGGAQAPWGPWGAAQGGPGPGRRDGTGGPPPGCLGASRWRRSRHRSSAMSGACPEGVWGAGGSVRVPYGPSASPWRDLGKIIFFRKRRMKPPQGPPAWDPETHCTNAHNLS